MFILTDDYARIATKLMTIQLKGASSMLPLALGVACAGSPTQPTA